MNKLRHLGLFLMFCSAGLSVLWGLSLNRSTSGGIMGFPGIYYGTRCLIQKCDPYSVMALEGFYRRESPDFAQESIQRRQSVTLYVNLPTTFLFVSPFALLPLKLAQLVWCMLIVGCFLLAGFLVWQLAATAAPALTLFLICFLLANSEIVFAGGNTAGFVVSLCVVAVWCFLQKRFELLGVLCLAISLAMKPHDGGLVWLYFLLAGGTLRKRALQTFALTTLFVLLSVLWVSWTAPHWIPEWRANLATISAPNGINDPRPNSIGIGSPDMMIQLQTAISIFTGNPRAYNVITYLLCAGPLLLWLITTLRSKMTLQRAYLALAAIAPLSMLFTYHRSYDAKLLLLCLPACAAVCARRDALSWIAGLLTTAAFVATGDIPLASVVLLSNHWNMAALGFLGKVLTMLVLRPAPVV
ncbi:MAG TPA: glycosyltransferase family 87 protein, partial [Terracidiphilus sp.]|nr:glycosyltransferase family 87 protein [Terracidiphilus sp.]